MEGCMCTEILPNSAAARQLCRRNVLRGYLGLSLFVVLLKSEQSGDGV